MRETFIKLWCDVCFRQGERNEAVFTEERGNKELSLCLECTNLPIHELPTLFQEYGMKVSRVDGPPRASRSPGVKTPDPEEDLDPKERVWTCRVKGCTRPGPYTKQGRSAHESRSHGGPGGQY